MQVSTTSAHEGSGYASAKVLQMAWHRMHNVRHRIKELEEAGTKHLKKQNQSSPAAAATGAVPVGNLPPQ